MIDDDDDDDDDDDGDDDDDDDEKVRKVQGIGRGYSLVRLTDDFNFNAKPALLIVADAWVYPSLMGVARR